MVRPCSEQRLRPSPFARRARRRGLRLRSAPFQRLPVSQMAQRVPSISILVRGCQRIPLTLPHTISASMRTRRNFFRKAHQSLSPIGRNTSNSFRLVPSLSSPCTPTKTYVCVRAVPVTGLPCATPKPAPHVFFVARASQSQVARRISVNLLKSILEPSRKSPAPSVSALIRKRCAVTTTQCRAAVRPLFPLTAIEPWPPPKR